MSMRAKQAPVPGDDKNASNAIARREGVVDQLLHQVGIAIRTSSDTDEQAEAVELKRILEARKKEIRKEIQAMAA